jgi:hypothetical protein
VAATGLEKELSRRARLVEPAPGDLMSEVLKHAPDSKEGPRAFVEKRNPEYGGKLG